MLRTTLRMHMLHPYVFAAFFVLAFASALLSAAAASFFPLFLLACQVFATVTTGDHEE